MTNEPLPEEGGGLATVWGISEGGWAHRAPSFLILCNGTYQQTLYWGSVEDRTPLAEHLAPWICSESNGTKHLPLGRKPQCLPSPQPCLFSSLAAPSLLVPSLHDSRRLQWSLVGLGSSLPSTPLPATAILLCLGLSNHGRRRGS